MDVIVARDNVSDDSYIIVEFCFNNGDKVNIGDIISVIESSKKQ